MKKQSLLSHLLCTVLLFCLFIPSGLHAQKKPKIRLIATGGTIAGVSASATQSNYEAGKLSLQALLDAVPGIHEIAEVSGEQIVKIGSQDMNDAIWLQLCKRISELLNREGYDGVVLTHGTDTMEETAYFLNLTVPSNKPVVLTGAMRPATGISADGPLNLYNAVVTAATPGSSGRGVLVCMNNLVLDAQDLSKTHTLGVQTFQNNNYGPLAYIYNGKVFYNRMPQNKHTYQSVFNVTHLNALPKVGIVYGYANESELPIKAFIEARYDGIIHAGVGNGNIYHSIFALAQEAVQKGIVFVRASRVPAGATTLDAEVDDARYHFVAAQTKNPQKARVLLMLALTKTKDWRLIQQYFNDY